MRQYLLDTTIVAAYLQSRPAIVELVQPWLRRYEAATSILVYGEVAEYLRSLPDFNRRHEQLRELLAEIRPYFVTYGIMLRYADLRRAMRPPQGPGLIGDIDTLVAATALERGLTVVTTDSDYARVPNLSLQLLDRSDIRRR